MLGEIAWIVAGVLVAIAWVGMLAFDWYLAGFILCAIALFLEAYAFSGMIRDRGSKH